MKIATLLLPFALALSLCGAARAATAFAPTDPRIVINAVNTPGDGGALYIITAPGSYYLDANLIGAPGKVGILVASDEVQLDLMGFHVRGTLAGAYGIVEFGPRTNIAVRNGRISDWVGVGVHFPSSSGVEVRQVGFRSNSAGAITLGADGLVEGCIVQVGFGYGITTGRGATISQSKVSLVDGTGISVGASSIVKDCTVRDCGNIGVEVLARSVVLDCSVAENGAGIYGEGGLVADCNVSGNLLWGVNLSKGTVRNCQIFDNGGHGIEFSQGGCLAVGNRISLNGGDGIRVEGGARIEDNDVRSHAQGAGIRTFGTGSFVVKNTLFTNAQHLVVPNSGNFVGPLVSTNAVNGRNDPWANVFGN